MASRTKQKEEARARRLAEERERAERARRQRRLRTIGGVALLAVALVAVAIAVSSSGGRTETGLQQGKTQTTTVASVNTLLSGIPQSGEQLGNPNAPVTMDYYGDFECPICQAFTLQGGLPQLIAQDVRSGKVKINYKSFETATRDPSVFKDQQVAALAAGQQHKFWQFAELFYHQQGAEGSGYVTENYLQGLAKQVQGLNLAQWEASRNDAALAAEVTKDGESGDNLGVSGTPTLVFTGRKGTTASPQSIPTYPQLEQEVQKVS